MMCTRSAPETPGQALTTEGGISLRDPLLPSVVSACPIPASLIQKLSVPRRLIVRFPEGAPTTPNVVLKTFVSGKPHRG